MSPGCVLPDATEGVAIRLSGFLQCQAQVMGENGFQALAGGPMMAALLSGLLTIFVALIGYRLMLGSVPTARDAVGWIVRIGLVIALGTGWPAFQSVVYRVVMDGPAQLAAIVLPAAGLSTDDVGERVQQVYDAIRTGTAAAANQVPAPVVPANAAASGTPPPIVGAAGEPQIASLFVVSTIGVPAALQLAAGVLLAIGPLMILALLFDATLGLFAGWLRALGGLTLGLVAADAVGALHLFFIEDAIVRARMIGLDTGSSDPQALTTIVLAFAVALAIALWATARVAGAIRLPPADPFRGGSTGERAEAERYAAPTFPPPPERAIARVSPAFVPPDRAQGVADALARSIQRDRRTAVVIGQSPGGERSERGESHAHRAGEAHPPASAALSATGQRMIGRRTRSAHQRDKSI